ncbi:MAG: hypothetical protein KAQ97_06110 [Candidatus Fermentibacteraceae bacterium]|nr:hypothetical protein [Candidatus Fermentibacteraceae bacterium]
MTRGIIPAIFLILMSTGCLGFWVHTPKEIVNIEAGQMEMRYEIDSLKLALEENENLLRGLQAQSSSRTSEAIARLTELAAELDLTLSRLAGTVGVSEQDTVSGPDARLLFEEAYRQFQQGIFEISAHGFMELHEKYPTSSLADDALYYMAICWEAAGQSHRAIEDLVALYYMYPSSEWAPGAIFRAADIYGAHSTPYERDRLFDLLLNKYPESDEAALVREQYRSEQIE